jgi:hypothetical protein
MNGTRKVYLGKDGDGSEWSCRMNEIGKVYLGEDSDGSGWLVIIEFVDGRRVSCRERYVTRDACEIALKKFMAEQGVEIQRPH